MDKIHLQLKGLAVGYRGEALIGGINIGVMRGELVTLIGPNGSGKSTILKTITRQLVPVAGDVLLADAFSKMRPLNLYQPDELARQLAVMLTGRMQTELMTCRDVAAMGRYPYTGRLGILSAADEAKVDAALAAVHAEHLADRPFDAVSDGERQRILLSRALCQEPAIIVLDEPTSFLDIRHKLELLEILHSMSRKEGITVVMSLHEIDLAMKISDRVICVRDHEIFACGRPADILDDETVRRLYDLNPNLGRFDARTGSLELLFTEQGRTPTTVAEEGAVSHGTWPEQADDAPPAKVEAVSDGFYSYLAQGGQGTAGASPDKVHLLPRLMLAAPGSGSGKTLITCGLLRLLQRRQRYPAAFKCGPDYIDPMFHRQVLGLPSRTLDTFFSPAGAPYGNTVNEIISRAVLGSKADIALIEGVMGYFDGTGVSGMEASSFDLARQTGTPVILIVNAKGMGRSILPLLEGFAAYEGEEGKISGVILNRVSAGMFSMMKHWIEEETRLQVLGYLPQEDVFSWGSRHLGLLLPQEIEDWQGKIDHLADILETTIDLEALLALAKTAPALKTTSVKSAPAFEETPMRTRAAPQKTPPQIASAFEETLVQTESTLARTTIRTGNTLDQTSVRTESALDQTPIRTVCVLDQIPQRIVSASYIAAASHRGQGRGEAAKPAPRIAVARDEAFNFYYEDNLELLSECGAELVFFSPLHDRALPAADGLLIGGGYPELHAQALAENESMKASIRSQAAKGMPVLAECGGFMYLQEALIIPGEGGTSDLQKAIVLTGEDGASDLQETLATSWGDGISASQEALVIPDENSTSEKRFQMCGLLPGTCRKMDHLVRFGYLELENKNSEAGYLKTGHHIRGHEFHYFDSTDNGEACTARKPGRKRSWDCMVVQGNIMAGFPHLYYRSDPSFAEAFVEKCRHRQYDENSEEKSRAHRACTSAHKTATSVQS